MAILLYFSLGDKSIVLSQESNTPIEIIFGASNSGLQAPFNPAIKTVTLSGNTVTVFWQNDDNIYHTVTSVTNSFASPPIEQGNSWNTTFSSVGNYNYYCSLHPYMTGTIIVQK